MNRLKIATAWVQGATAGFLIGASIDQPQVWPLAISISAAELAMLCGLLAAAGRPRS
ncbi:hypothetical protein [Streptacidiphilus albus]|uniref:hypothetical protein n=1 Tax=Streptacidiphilus albus TaxID=105425 RepID=UPI000B1C23CA|nr:hypothetical protein [Streptacidiphilus albus]